MTPEYTNQLATELLLSGLMGVLALGLMATASVLVWMRRGGKARAEAAGRLHEACIAPHPYHPSVFENSCRWMVIKSRQVGRVQAALGLHNPVPCSWEEGVGGLANRKLFVSPRIGRWILVVGQGLPDPSEDIDQCFHFIVRLSRKLGEVQFFSVNRPVNHHAWVRAQKGQVRRAYAWAGETLWNQGPPTRAELDLGLKCLDYGERGLPDDLLSGERRPTNAEKISFLAARWSFDPTTVDESAFREALGVAGDASNLRPH